MIVMSGWFLLLWTTLGWNVFLTAGLLPQVSQEGLLRPYHSYADVTLFHYYVPTEVTRATFEFAAFMDSPSCPQRDVYVYLQHGSYPVMSADNASFPPNLYTERSSMIRVGLRATYQPPDTTVVPVYDPLPGSWFAAAYLPDWDQHVQQEGIGHRCQYSLGSIALWSQVASVDTIPLETTSRLKSEDRFTYLKFYIPSSIWEFTVRVDSCEFATRSRVSWDSTGRDDLNRTKNGTLDAEICLRNIFIRSRALPTNLPSGQEGLVLAGNASSYTHVESLPQTDSYYYLLVVADTRVEYNISISVRECPLQILGKSFVQHFAGVNLAANLKEQALRVNNTVSKSKDLSQPGCGCVPIFRLTRIKHAQDFSDTFLLEGKEWFTTWLALTDVMPVGASMEILPFVDIGGTLSISIHMDELLINATTQELHVTACVRRSRVPEPLCCSSDATNISACCENGLTLHISSLNTSTVDDTLLIPYPEPDIWYISFTTVCYFEGKKVPCAVEDALVSLDVRTQACVFSTPSPSDNKIRPCGSYGVCQELHKGQYFYTACHCIGGYRGWGCTDDSQATPDYILITTTLLLTISNIFFIPAIILAARRRMFTHVLVYTCTMTASTLYHACDQDLYGYCLTRYQVLQFCDFFCSILAFWVTLIALARNPPKYDSALFVLGAIVIAVGVEYNRTGLMVFIVPFCLGIGIPVAVWSYRSIRSKKCLTPSLSSVLLFFPGVLLGGAGLVLFAFVETEDNYRYTHSAWHVIIALSLVYLLPKQKSKMEARLPSDITFQSNNSAELAPVYGNYQPNGNSSSPVFFITSDLDHLVQQ